MTTAPAIELQGISKAFGPVQANKDISIRVMPGTIHGIIGENGAGKSTLMSILYGFYKADKGEIFISGQKRRSLTAKRRLQLASAWCSSTSSWSKTSPFWKTSFWAPKMVRFWPHPCARRAKDLSALAAEYGLNVDPDALIQDIGVGMQQRVEILKALYPHADILILDEPTGVLDACRGRSVVPHSSSAEGLRAKPSF